MKKQTKTQTKMTEYEQQMTGLALKWLHRFKVEPSKSIIDLTHTVEQMDNHEMVLPYLVGEHTINRDDILSVLSDPPKEMAVAILKGLKDGYKARIAEGEMILKLTDAMKKVQPDGEPMVSHIDIEEGKITVWMRFDRRDEMWTACFEGNSLDDIISQLGNEDEWDCEIGDEERDETEANHNTTHQ